MARLSTAHRQTMLDSAWFGGLPPAARDEALDLATLRHLHEGELLYAKDRCADAWFGVLEGAIRLGASAPDGRQGLLAFLEPGTWFGDTSLFDGLPRPHDAVAHGPAAVLALSTAQFEGLLERYPVLYRHFIALYCQRTRLMYFALEAWTAFPLDERLARHLLNLAAGHGQRDGDVDDIAINLRLPQEQLAQLLGVSRQRVSQILRDWEDRGWLHFRYGRIVLNGRWIASQPAGAQLLAMRGGRVAVPH